MEGYTYRYVLCKERISHGNGRESEDAGECSNPGVEEEVWKVCWNLRLPNVVKMFIWRALHNLLPTRVNLRHKGVVKDNLCPLCAKEPETTEHITWECPSAADVWSYGPVCLQKLATKGMNFFFFSQLFKEVKRKVFKK